MKTRNNIFKIWYLILSTILLVSTSFFGYAQKSFIKIQQISPKDSHKWPILYITDDYQNVSGEVDTTQISDWFNKKVLILSKDTYLKIESLVHQKIPAQNEIGNKYGGDWGFLITMTNNHNNINGERITSPNTMTKLLEDIIEESKLYEEHENISRKICCILCLLNKESEYCRE